jgi:hypothetical protein
MTLKLVLKTLKKVDYFLIGVILFLFYLVFVAMGKVIFKIINWRKKVIKKSFWVDGEKSNICQFRSSY